MAAQFESESLPGPDVPGGPLPNNPESLAPPVPNSPENIAPPVPELEWNQGEALAYANQRSVRVGGPFWWLRQIFAPFNRSGDIGVGRGRLVYAPFEIARSQPLNHFGIGYESVYNLTLPDRAEFDWGRPSSLPGGRGPATIEQSVNYQDLRFISEVGSDRLSVATEIPIRSLDPAINANTTGLSDMSVTSRAVLMDGSRWQVTQFFRSSFQTGAVSKGLGNGHVSLEPGVLFGHDFRQDTYLHGEIRYWIPVGGNPNHSGQILRSGIGLSHLFYDTDAFAVIPTLEFVGMWVLDGQKTPFPAGPAANVDGEFIAHLFPGVRFVSDSGGDFGLFEVGLGGGFDLGSTGSYDGTLRMNVRWSR